jgi:transcriptional regulator GlxA family with amidase domain
LLLDTERPVAEIALETGFSDQSHLTRVFRRALGETPAALRRRFRHG